MNARPQQECAGAIMTYKIEEKTVQAATIVHAAATILATIDVAEYDILTLFPVYVKGDETSLELLIFWTAVHGGTPVQEATWSTDAARTPTNRSYKWTASGSEPIQLDVSHLIEVVIKDDATDGTPDGTLALDYLLARKD